MIIHVHIWETLECLWERYKTTVFNWNFQLKTYWNLHTWEVITLIIQLVIHISAEKKDAYSVQNHLFQLNTCQNLEYAFFFNYLLSEKSIALKRTSNCCFFFFNLTLRIWICGIVSLQIVTGLLGDQKGNRGHGL